MKILYAASEALPYASTGGLADVVGSLPQAVKKELGEGADVRVVIPLYSAIRRKFAEEIQMVCELNVKLAWRNQYCGIWQTQASGVTFYFIDNEYYFNRSALYGSFDDAERFAYFGKAIMELMAAVGFYPDVLHANDWQTAPAVIYLKRKYAHLPDYQGIRTLFTIHNIDYQGIYDFSILGDIFELAEWDRSIVEYNGCINLLKGAVVCSDMVSTVSSRYADEILTEYYASGLQHILRASRDKLCGIVNGIDVDYYSAEADPEIAENFTAEDLSGKAACKAELEEVCGFPHAPGTPILAMVSRLASHKGFDLVTRVIEDLLTETNLRFALLGTGEFELEDFFTRLADRFPGRVCVKLEY
ncbi:MAG: glycogen synthase, partial [Clostridia bacterium]|nr:glycogen synthase [Clostridia bacterium]